MVKKNLTPLLNGNRDCCTTSIISLKIIYSQKYRLAYLDLINQIKMNVLFKLKQAILVEFEVAFIHNMEH